MQLKYSDGFNIVTMPRTRPFTLGGTLESKRITLANKKRVSEIIGFRPSFVAEWDWVPQDILKNLLVMLRKNPFLTVTYIDPVEGEVTGVYEVTYPEVSVWVYRLGVPFWHKVKIEHIKQEVI